MTQETPDESQAPESSPQTETLAQQSPATRRVLRVMVFLVCAVFGSIFGVILRGGLNLPLLLVVPLGVGVIALGYKFVPLTSPFLKAIFYGFGSGMSVGTAAMELLLSNIAMC